MDHVANLRKHFAEGIELRTRMMDTLAPEVAKAGVALAAAIKRGKKALACGNGGSAADSQHFAAEMVGRFERERPGMPAIALTTDTSGLTAIANDYGYDYVFSKGVEALGQEGDVLLGISTSGNSKSVIEAIKAAHAKNMTVIALTGRDGGQMAKMLKPTDFHLNVAHPRTMRVQEVHLLVVHCLCEVVDNELHFGGS
ncbi:phosphoheptose isomerase [Usitatibacter palustris]|uniref:Phosphoheptose isomerase n=1 Tax=Usitatibacter palustris TaxID=2732487 RepID=A0A6M4H317_9PROT|nr:phosphoheptose isomerase [Usitatibacter palustris]QJR13830.1 Phosphoheptose isomerase [Usitatibacter palustris]